MWWDKAKVLSALDQSFRVLPVGTDIIDHSDSESMNLAPKELEQQAKLMMLQAPGVYEARYKTKLVRSPEAALAVLEKLTGK
ncbi:hypothetical protein BCO18442_05868 [Burkholderia contaminans]|nr:hypothetical protein BCO18442_05868 [Burkholderia contaminans]